MNNMLESQTITKAVLDYYPQVFYNHHQTASVPGAHLDSSVRGTDFGESPFR